MEGANAEGMTGKTCVKHMRQNATKHDKTQ
jgi:hypothetical protein